MEVWAEWTVIEMKKRKAPQTLKEKFDNFFDSYCRLVPLGKQVKMFIPDTENNRVMMGEFQNYLQQRASYEGWQYKVENFQVVYSSKITKLNNEIWLANPYQENIGWEKVAKEPGVFIKLDQKGADRVRTLLEIIDN